MNDLPVILFPHSCLSASSLKKIFSFFGPITIFQPWFMESTRLLSETGDSRSIQVMNPPSKLRPGEGFKALLSEYHNWIQYNQDKSYTEYLKATQGPDFAEDTTWEIRRTLRQMNQGAPIPEEDHTSRWHLILHLAQEIEDQRIEADRMLKVLKEKDPPLKGLIEESDHVERVLGDLPQFESELMAGEHQLRQILEAWFGLFGGYLKGDELLITFNRNVLDYVSEIWDDLSHAGKTKCDSVIRFKVPDLSHKSMEDLAKIKTESYNKGKIKELKNLIIDFADNPIRNLPTQERLFHDVEASCPWELARGTLNIVVQYISPVTDNEHVEMEGITEHLSHKTIILMEAEPNDE